MYVDMALDALITQAVQEKVSDIHFDAGEDETIVRFRRDGLLVDIEHIESSLRDQYVNRIKVLSGLDISEKRLPQDGRWDWSPVRETPSSQ